MPSLNAVSVWLAVTIGVLPSTRHVESPYRAQSIQQTAVQASCPTQLELAAGPSTSVLVNGSLDRVWLKVRDSLNTWSSTAASSDPKRIVRNGATLIVEPVSTQLSGQPSGPGTVGRTCFYEWRTGNTDTRLAFKFSARAVKGKTPSTDIEVRWLSQTKGSAQRTWRNTPAESGLLNSLLEILGRSSATGIGRGL